MKQIFVIPILIMLLVGCKSDDLPEPMEGPSTPTDAPFSFYFEATGPCIVDFIARREDNTITHRFRDSCVSVFDAINLPVDTKTLNVTARPVPPPGSTTGQVRLRLTVEDKNQNNVYDSHDWCTGFCSKLIPL